MVLAGGTCARASALSSRRKISRKNELYCSHTHLVNIPAGRPAPITATLVYSIADTHHGFSIVHGRGFGSCHASAAPTRIRTNRSKISQVRGLAHYTMHALSFTPRKYFQQLDLSSRYAVGSILCDMQGQYKHC